MKGVSVIATLFFCPLCFSQQAILTPPSSFDRIDPFNNTITCPKGGGTSISKLIWDRIPSFSQPSYSSNVPLQCRNNANDVFSEKINEFKKQDFSKIQSLANSYCSHLSGWVEYEPGTCSAGGPPPICPVNHWKYVGYAEGMAAYNAETSKIRNERLRQLEAIKQELNNQICGCWKESVSEYKKQVFSKIQVDHPNDKIEKVTLTNMKMPCLDGCPTGYKCVNGFCEKEINMTDRGWQNVTDALKEKGQDKVKDKILDFSIEMLSKLSTWSSKIFNVWNNFGDNFCLYITVGKAIFQTTDVGNSNMGFMNKVKDINDGVNRLEMLYDELKRLYSGKSLARDVGSIKNDIATERSKLGKNLYLLNDYKQTIKIEKTIGFCPGMLDFYTSSIWEYANAVIAVPIQ